MPLSLQPADSTTLVSARTAMVFVMHLLLCVCIKQLRCSRPVSVHAGHNPNLLTREQHHDVPDVSVQFNAVRENGKHISCFQLVPGPRSAASSHPLITWTATTRPTVHTRHHQTPCKAELLSMLGSNHAQLLRYQSSNVDPDAFLQGRPEAV